MVKVGDTVRFSHNDKIVQGKVIQQNSDGSFMVENAQDDLMMSLKSGALQVVGPRRALEDPPMPGTLEEPEDEPEELPGGPPFNFSP